MVEMPDALVLDEVAETLRSMRGQADRAAEGEVEGDVDSDQDSDDAIVSVAMAPAWGGGSQSREADLSIPHQCQRTTYRLLAWHT